MKKYMDKKETIEIGKINIDLTFYSGEDRYCDGETEDELLKITRDYAEVEYPRIIEERRSWEILYHLSKQRENIVEWLPLQKDMKVLEVGSGCGAVTGALAARAGSVTCIDLSKKRSMINAYRHTNCENISVYVGNFQDMEPSLPCDYDYICLIGVFEYAQAYIGGENPYEEFLHILKRHMKKDGHMVIAIENKFGLKYWAGCKEDHLGSYFSGLEGYSGGGMVRTFTRNGLEKILENCDIGDYSFYYPYPDYKFMTSLYSDEYPPGIGELSNNLRNFDRDRMLLFDEKRVFDEIIRDGLFPLYSNSYLVVIGPELNTKYVKYSNDRQPEYQIRTEMIESAFPPGQLVVRKHPLCIAANEHIRNIEVAFEKLRERYIGGELKINRCKLVGMRDQLRDNVIEENLRQGKQSVQDMRPFVEFEFIEGIALSELLDEALEKDDMETFLKLFRKYLEMVDYRSGEPVADFDLAFSNILIGIKDIREPFDAIENSVWTLIDYEWTFGKQISTKELAFRALYCYLLEDEKRNKLNLDLILKELEITDKEAEEFREQELAFQRFVTGNRRSMTEIRDLIGYKCFRPEEWLEKIRTEERRNRVQVYENRGGGFREEDSYFVESMREDEEGIHLSLVVEAGMRQLRIDPAFGSCMVRLKNLSFNEKELKTTGQDSVLTANGTRLDESNSFVFTTDDPGIMISLENMPFEEENFLDVCYEISFLSHEMAADMESAAKRRLRL